MISEDDETGQMWLSRYALSDGKLLAVSGRVSTWTDGTQYLSTPKGGFHRVGRDVHLTRDEAVKAAKAMRDKKVASVQKQLRKLQEMKFE